MRPHLILTILALALTASAAPLPSGTYTGTGTALNPAATGKPLRAEVSQEGGYNFAKIISLQPGENSYEEWVWDDTTLTVKQHLFIPGSQRADHRMAEEVTQYGATTSHGSYHIDCTDRGLNDCDMGLDARCYWTIAATADGFTCEAWGPADRHTAGNPIQLQTLTFQRAQ